MNSSLAKAFEKKGCRNSIASITKLESELPIYPRQLISRALSRRGWQSTKNRDFEAAISYYTIAILVDSANPAFYYSRGLARHMAGQPQDAIADLKKAVNLRPGYDEAYVSLSAAMHALGDFHAALHFIDRAVSINGSAANLNARGMLYGLNNRHQKAIDDFSAAIGLDPQMQCAYYNRGAARMEIKDYDGAISDLAVSLRMNPKDALSSMQLGEACLGKGNIEMALHYLNRAIALAPRFPLAYKERAGARAADNNMDGYMEDMEMAIRLGQESASRLFQLPWKADYAVMVARSYIPQYKEALVYLCGNRIAESLDRLDSFVYATRVITEFSAMLYEGQKLRDSGRYNDAMAVFTECIRCDSENGESFFQRGFTRKLNNDANGAIEDYSMAISLGLRERNIYMERAEARMDAQDYEGAISDFTEAIGRIKSPQLFQKRGYAKYLLDDYDSAIKDFNEGISINSAHPLLHYYRSLCLSKKGMHKEALADCRNAISINNSDASFYMHSGALKEILGDSEGAIGDYTSAIRISPKNARAYEKRSHARFMKGDIGGYFDDDEKARSLQKGDYDILPGAPAF